MTILPYVLGVVLAYLIGGIPFGYLMGRLAGIDIRRWGSGNIGATNVMRVINRGAGTIVLALDILKGVAGVALFGWLTVRLFDVSPPGLLYVLCGGAVIVGHTFTPFLGFKGGKGVAAALGVWLVLAPIETLIALGVWIVLVAIWRYVSLGSIFAGATLPTALEQLILGQIVEILPRLVFAVLLAALIIVRHRSNITRLLSGTESTLGASKKPSPRSTGA